jgi:hypothetical protein
MGMPRTDRRTDKGSFASDEKAFLHITEVPFLRPYWRYQKFYKARHTYLSQIARELCGEFLHPSYSLSAVSHRSASQGPNFQNFPARDHEIMTLIRRCFVPRKGRRLVEVDGQAMEVRYGYFNHRDEQMQAYLLDPSSDMHRDVAADVFGLPVDWLLTNAGWAKKTLRDWVKGFVVFAQFYGSAYFQCAARVWEAVTELDEKGDYRHRLPGSGLTVVDHLKSQGVTRLGACDPKLPAQPGSFEHRLQRVEKRLWDRFAGYQRWRKRVWADYQRTAEFHLLTGFVCRGLFKKNQVTNYPVQGVAFHGELKGICFLQEWIDRVGADVLLVGQIHDSVLADVSDSWLQDYLEAARRAFTQQVPEVWQWARGVPIEIEAEVCGVDDSWDTKKQWTRGETGVWSER